LLLVAASIVALLSCAVARADDPVVIVISLDGVRHDHPERGEFPALQRMAQEGARAERLVPVFPSNTFPTHVSLATGTHPDRHGIVDNRFFDRRRGAYDREADASWIDAEPLWVAAERQGVPSAVYFWVGSETDWRGTGARFRMTPFDRDVDERAKVNRILAWLDLPAERRPRLVMSWWNGVDRVGHLKGALHPDVFDALAEQTGHLETLLAALDARDAWSNTTLLVVSDHGMTSAGEVVPLRERLEDAGLGDATLVAGTSVAHVFLDSSEEIARAEKALRQLEGVAIYSRDTLPRGLRLAHPQRTGDLVLLVEPPRTFREPNAAQRLGFLGRGFGWTPSLHGYSPGHPDMGAVFYAMGRGVPAGSRPGRVRMIDVAPTVARLLSIEPPRDAEGSPIPGLAE
jgi:predicted AlkP superfamily pyrophosphatase or phosphodiesterase